MQIPFKLPTKKVYNKRIIDGYAPVSKLRLVVVGKSGERHSFLLHLYTPFFEPETPRHYFSPCGRFVVLRHGQRIDDKMIRAGEQYSVYYHGNLIPDERYALSHSAKPAQYRPRSAYKAPQPSCAA